MDAVPEIRRERITIPPEMTMREIKEKYGLTSKQAGDALKSGFFVKNYSRKQVIIDRENFDPSVSYSTAKRVYKKNFSMNPLAETIKEDLIQEAVTRMYELRSCEKIAYPLIPVVYAVPRPLPTCVGTGP